MAEKESKKEPQHPPTQGGTGVTPAEPVKTLRDEFALAVIQGVAGRHALSRDDDIRHWTTTAYRIADQALIARVTPYVPPPSDAERQEMVDREINKIAPRRTAPEEWMVYDTDNERSVGPYRSFDEANEVAANWPNAKVHKKAAVITTDPGAGHDMAEAVGRGVISTRG